MPLAYLDAQTPTTASEQGHVRAHAQHARHYSPHRATRRQAQCHLPRKPCLPELSHLPATARPPLRDTRKLPNAFKAPR